MLDIQKAGMWKRISAYLLDVILLITLIVWVAWVLSLAFGYDDYSNQFNEIRTQYEEEYNVDFDADFDSLSDEKKMYTEMAFNKFSSNEDAQYAYTMMIMLALAIVSISIVVAYFILEFILPVIFKNGRTLGKKIFGVAVMRADGVKISGPALFVRAIFGKCIVETMVPIFIVIMILLGNGVVVGLISLILIALLQIILIIATKTRSAIHDVLAYTVTVDFVSQVIFNTPEELLEYKKKLHAEDSLHKER